MLKLYPSKTDHYLTACLNNIETFTLSFAYLCTRVYYILHMKETNLIKTVICIQTNYAIMNMYFYNTITIVTCKNDGGLKFLNCSPSQSRSLY